MDQLIIADPDPDSEPEPPCISINDYLTDVTIKNVFKYLPLNEIIKCRAVCQYWNQFASTILHRRIDEIRIKIVNPTELKRFICMESRSDLIFTNYIFMEPLFNHEAYITFFKQPREEITSFSLACSKATASTSGLTLKRFRDLLQVDLPGLRKLSLGELPLEFTKSKKARIVLFSQQVGITSLTFNIESTRVTYSDDFLCNLYWATPQVKELILDTFSFDLPAAYYAWSLQPRDNVGATTSLSINNDYTDLSILQLEQLFRKARIRSFKANLFGIEGNTLSGGLLAAQKTTLEVFELRVRNWRNFEFPFPIMQNLVTLSILSYDPLFPTVGDINYGIQFPKLKTLKIRNSPVKVYTPVYSGVHPGLRFFPESSEPCPTVTELELPDYLQDASTMRNIGRIFPNVRKLKMGNQGPEILKTLWELWPGLEVLGLTLYQRVNSRSTNITDLDSTFNGIVPEECSTSSRNQSGDSSDLKVQDRIPSIRHLTALKYLILHGGINVTPLNESSTFKLSDITGYLSLVKLENLQCLLLDPRLHNMSLPCIENICEKLGLINNSTYSGGFPNPSLVHLVRYDWMTQINWASPRGTSEFPCTNWDKS